MNTNDAAPALNARTLRRHRIALACLGAAVLALATGYQQQRAETATAWEHGLEQRARADAAERELASARARLQNIESGGVVPHASRIAIARGVYERGEPILTSEMDAKKAPEPVTAEQAARQRSEPRGADAPPRPPR